jgi:alkanesulfonate monooxygenase SsuD/methylene tetrahydromethanopterin reductase-like flavin-dependent oxidoreductase (luciferase family)
VARSPSRSRCSATRSISTRNCSRTSSTCSLRCCAKSSTRPDLIDQRVYPRTESGLTAWVGIGGNPQSVIRAARHGLPLMIAIIGGESHRFAPLVDLFHRALGQLGQPELPVGVHSPGHVADTDDAAKEQLWPHWQQMRNRIGAERGWGPTSRAEFEAAAGPTGALYVGAPETVATKIAETVLLLGLSRFDMKYSAGTLPHEAMMHSIELYGTEVIPRVRELLAADGEALRSGHGLAAAVDDR